MYIAHTLLLRLLRVTPLPSQLDDPNNDTLDSPLNDLLAAVSSSLQLVMTSGYAIATLVVFIVSVFFVIHPVSIPTLRLIPRASINLSLSTTPILAIALLWATHCIDFTVIRDGILGTEGVKPYNIIILFFSLAYIAITLDISGILRAAAFWVSNKSGDNGWKLYLYFYVLFSFASILVGNDPIILSGTPFLIYYTQVAILDPRPWIIAEFAAANTAGMALFVSNPTNVIICEGFGLNPAAFTAYTIVPFLVCNIFCFATLAFQFRKQVPWNLRTATYRDPWTVIRDPVGALVGSVIVIMMLTLYHVPTFFAIDVWMISLPFAFAKLIFDLGWDCYRYSLGRPTVVDEDLDDGSSTMSRPQMEDCDSINSLLPPDPQPPLSRSRSYMNALQTCLVKRLPTLITTLPRLPFSLVPFAFSQFILIEALDHQGWVDIFSNWLIRASHKEVHPTIWAIGVLSVILCSISGTNIGATFLLTKVVRAAALPLDATRGAAIALAVASNIGAVNFTFSSSLAGLIWKAIVEQKGIPMKQWEFAFWNLLPLLVMTVVGLSVVSAEMAVLQARS